MSKTKQKKIKETLDAFQAIRKMNDLTLTVPTAPAHWYRASGEALHTIDMTNGGERNTTLRDARKMNLFPSVTTVLKDVLVNYGVQKWLRNTLLESAYTLPESFRLQEFSNYKLKVEEDAEEFGAKARDFGSKVHEAIDCFHINQEYIAEEEIEPWLNEYREWFAANIVHVISSEETVVNAGTGYAGRMDLVAEHVEHGYCVIDFKTQRAKGNIKFYDTWQYQLAAYRECLPSKAFTHRPNCLSVAMNSMKAEAPVEKLWTPQEVKTGWDVFRRVCEIWQLQRGYFPVEEGA